MIVCSDNLCPMNNLDFLRLFGQNKDYLHHQDSELSECVKNTDLFISDDKCTHRIIGLQKKRYNLQISIICAHYEIIRIKQIIFQMNKKVICDSQLSAKLFKYPKGSNIYPTDLETKFIQKILIYFYPNLKIKLNKQEFSFSERTFSYFLTFEEMISLFGKPDFFRCDCSAVWNLLWNIKITVNFLPSINNYVTNIFFNSGDVNLEMFTEYFFKENCHGCKKEILMIQPKIKVTLCSINYLKQFSFSFEKSETSIYKAVTEKNFRVIKQLITNTKSDINILCGPYWQTPLMYAIRNNLSLRIIILLMKKSDLTVTDWLDRDIDKIIKAYSFNNKIKYSLEALFFKYYKLRLFSKNRIFGIMGDFA